MLQYVLNTPTKIFCQYCPRRKVLRRGTVLSSICQASWPSPTTTLDRKRTSKERHHVWWVERFLFFRFFRFFPPGFVGCCTLSQIFSVRSVLADKASVEEQVPSFLKIGHQHIYKCFFVSTVLGEKSSDVEQSWAAFAVAHHHIGQEDLRTWKRRHHVWWVDRVVCLLSFLFFFLSFLLMRSLPVCMGMDAWVNVFRMLFLCVDLTV